MSVINHNSQIISSESPCIRHNDRGFTLGHGLFETLLVKQGSIPALEYHWQRLENSAPVLGLSIPFSRTELASMLNELITKNNLQDKLAGARVTITHGKSERGLLPLNTPHPNFLITVFECATPVDRPYSALIVNTRKNEQSAAARVKSISYMDNILAKQEAMNQGYDEAILLNSVSNVADGSISNVFMVKDDQLITPPISDGALPGVVRHILLTEFNDVFSMIERSFSPAELMMADEIFLTNALMGIKSVNRINDKKIDAFTVANDIRNRLKEEKNYI